MIVGSGTWRADADKVATIDAIRVPVTKKKQLRQVIGFFSYFRDSIPNFAALAKPLTDLTKNCKSNKVCWTETEQNAFDNLKRALRKATEEPLYIIDMNRDFRLMVDASEHTASGVSTQIGVDGTEYPIAFYSWKLNPTQQRWSTVKKEAYAAALRRVRQWVFGTKVTLLSDHNPLTYLTESAPKSAKLLRWSFALLEFNVTFEYRAGKTHVVPDFLIRMCSNW